MICIETAGAEEPQDSAGMTSDENCEEDVEQ